MRENELQMELETKSSALAKSKTDLEAANGALAKLQTSCNTARRELLQVTRQHVEAFTHAQDDARQAHSLKETVERANAELQIKLDANQTIIATLNKQLVDKELACRTEKVYLFFYNFY
jgi:chromosome segregation ATPase